MMKQHETVWLRKIIFLSIAILATDETAARIKPAFAQVASSNFDRVIILIELNMIVLNSEA